jgi:hypothetical protein
MTGFWLCVGVGTLLGVLSVAEAVCARRWRWWWSSGPGVGFGALIGMNAVLLAFIGIGVLIEGVLDGNAWFRNDPTALWGSIFSIWFIFVYGALRTSPWVIACATRSLAESGTGHTIRSVQ